MTSAKRRRTAGARRRTPGESASARNRRAPAAQLPLAFPASWGGRRAGAGRKPGPRPLTPHRARPAQRAGEPVLVTLRARIAPLRSQFVFPTVRLALVRASRREPARFRIAHFSVQRDHVHLVVEAQNKRALSGGMRGVAIRVARYVNELLGRRGPLWASRWHGRALGSPREVRGALLYVLGNFRKHARRSLPAGVDPYSSGAWFDGWRGGARSSGVPPPYAVPGRWRSGEGEGDSAAFAARTWLGAVGWRRCGLLGTAERPVG